MTKKQTGGQYIFVTTIHPGTEDEYKVVNLSAEDAFDSEDGDGCLHEIYEKVKDVTITRTVNIHCGKKE